MIALPILLQVAAATASPAAASVQQMFAAAEAASDKADLPAALSAWDGLETHVHAARTLAIIRLRKGDVLYRMGRFADADAALTSGLAVVSKEDPTLREDRYQAHLSLAGIRMRDLDHADARLHLRAALGESSGPAMRANVLIPLSRATMFDDPAAALAQIDEALALAKTVSGTSKETLGSIRTQRGRVLLNQQKFAAAASELKLAVDELGGLTMKVSRADVVARSDVGIAAMLAKDGDTARRYLAFTGAGHGEQRFGAGAVMTPPQCGGTQGLSPSDVAVVEFEIADDGSVDGVTPIYASRSGPMAVTFAQAVAGWSWTPEETKGMSPFFRSLIRVQVQCTTTAERPDVVALLRPDVDRWLAERGVAPFDAGVNAAQAVPKLREELKRREAMAGQPLAAIPVLIALSANKTVPEQERLATNRRLIAVADDASTPPAVRVFLGDLQAIPWRPARLQDSNQLRALLADPAVAADARAAGTARLVIGDGLRGTGAEAIALYQATADDARLGEHDPLRVGARVRLASAQARAGELAAAQASYLKTGLDAQQCALVDAKPIIKRTNLSSEDYPREAIQWGFEGWVVTEFDIDAAGRTANQRAIVAYPPFVFDTSTVSAVKDTRYQQTYRPAGGLGCGGQTLRVQYRMPV